MCVCGGGGGGGGGHIHIWLEFVSNFCCWLINIKIHLIEKFKHGTSPLLVHMTILTDA